MPFSSHACVEEEQNAVDLFPISDKQRGLKVIKDNANNIKLISLSLSSSYSISHIELPIHIVPTVEATMSPICVSALTHLPEILLEEEMESYFASQEHCKDLLTSVHNTGGKSKTQTAIVLQVL